MDFEKARFNMIEQQIRPWEVLSPELEQRLFAVKRELFVPVRYCNLAFADVQIPLGHGACLLTPAVEARMANALRLKRHDRVLEIGTGSGYMAALLASMTRHVDSVEIVPELAETARENLDKAGVLNVAVSVANGLDAGAIAGNYDVIVLSGSLPLPPQPLTEHLRTGGRMVAIIGTGDVMSVQLSVRRSESSGTTVSLFETVAPALLGAPRRAFSL